MISYIFKYGIKILVFITSRHRLIGVRDWLASIFFIILLAVAALAFAILWFVQGLGETSLNVEHYLKALIIIASVIIVALAPIVYILKLRRNGITDADFSVANGFDYKASLQSAHYGFDFLGISGSKLRAHDSDLKEAIRLASRHEKRIRMLLVAPSAASVIDRMEKMDGAVGYAENIEGTVTYLKKLAENDPECFEIRQYSPTSIEEIKPLRLFFAGSDCLVSPFSPRNGEADQGRGLPQLRITEHGFPRKGEVTLYGSLRKYFESSWLEEK